MKFSKINWTGGMSSQIDPTKIDPQTQYYLGVNIRTRRNIADTILAPLDLTSSLPDTGKIQGLYTYGTTLVIFISGRAYYRTSATTPWVLISALSMSPDVDEIDCCAVPSSTINFITTAAVGSTSQKSNAVVLGNPIAASPQALIAMDGVTQPYLIFADGTARITQNYAEWTLDDPEYVPIARLPTYVNGILYCVGKDLAGNYTQIYRSVSGRPLNFVILITDTGKADTSEELGGAPALANRVSTSPVTAMGEVPALPGGFLVTTANASWLVTPDFTNLIAGEPQFDNQFLFDVGAVNKNSIVSVLGDTTVVCAAGVRSFNGVNQFRWQGKNAPFSAKVNNFISAHVQTNTSCVSYNDYAYYAVQTVYGPGILVYDFLLENFVSVDLYDGVLQIRQFAKVQTGVVEELYFYTTDNKFYQALVGTPARAAVYLCDFTPSESFGAHRITDIWCNFSNISEGGYVQAVAYTDRVPYFSGAQEISAEGVIITEPITVPFNTPLAKDVAQVTFGYQDQTKNGWRATAGVIWDASASLLEVGLETIESDSFANVPVQAQVPVTNLDLIFVGNDGVSSAARREVLTAMQREAPDYILGAGNHAYNAGSTSDINTALAPYWNNYHEMPSGCKFFAVPGAVDLDTTNGEPIYDWLRQAAEHYSYRDFGEGVARVFFITAGYNSAGTQVEPSNLTAATIIDSQQMVWLQTNLAASPARLNIVVWFNPQSSSNPTITPRLTDIPLHSWGADMLICGDSGMYERCVDQYGFVQITVGTGGAALYTGSLTPAADSKIAIQNTLGYLRMSASPLTAVCEFVDTAGTVLDSFVL